MFRAINSDVQQGVAQGCSLSPILFSVFINGLLKEVEQAGLGVVLSDGSTIGDMLFADDFVGVSNSEEELQRLINVAHAYCCKWRLKANVSKSAVVVFARELVEGSWKWGQQTLLRLSKYTYLDVDFTSNGAWDEHVKRVLQNGRKTISQMHSIDLTARRLLLISVVRPTLEYGSEVWEGNKAQAAALESANDRKC